MIIVADKATFARLEQFLCYPSAACVDDDGHSGIENEKRFHRFLGLPQYSGKYPFTFFELSQIQTEWGSIRTLLNAGEDLLFMGTKGFDCLREIWLDADDLVSVSAVKIGDTRIECKTASFWSIRPPDRYSLHGIHEEPRLYVRPYAQGLDQYGKAMGSCGILCRNVKKSLSGGNFEGALWVALAINPESVTNDLLREIAEEFLLSSTGVYIAEIYPEFAYYNKGERVKVILEVGNKSPLIQAVELTITLQSALRGSCSPIDAVKIPLMLNATDLQSVSFDFYPVDCGVHTINVELALKNKYQYGHDREIHGMLVDVRSENFVVDRISDLPQVKIDHSMLMIGGKKGFHLGTHLYPSSIFFEGSYRPVRLSLVENAAAIMKRSGITICRLWCDPLLDETSIRAMRAIIEVLGSNGIAAIVTLFSSWTREMRVQTSSRQTSFFTADMLNDQFIGLTMVDIEKQCDYVEELAKRFADLSNIIWDFSNEFSVVKQTQDNCASPTRQSIDYFREWAGAIRSVIRRAGANQIVHFGVNCWDTGSDNFLCNYNSDIMPTHLYCHPDQIQITAALTNPRSIRKPFLLEEFGGPWANDMTRKEEYAVRYFEFLAAGFNGAVNYEWGVLWTSMELPGTPPFMKYNSHFSNEELEGFHFEGRRLYAKTWSEGSTGLCPWLASMEYGVIRPCVSGVTRTTQVMTQFARLTGNIFPIEEKASICVLVPFETLPYQQGVGYSRIKSRLHTVLHRLWNLGAEYILWQVEDLQSIPDFVDTIIYPNEQEICPEVLKKIEAYRQQGKEVLTGEKTLGFYPARAYKALFDSANSRVHIRSDGSSRLISVFTDVENQFHFGDWSMKIGKLGMLYESEDRVQSAAINGEIRFNNKLICKTSMLTGILFPVKNDALIGPHPQSVKPEMVDDLMTEVKSSSNTLVAGGDASTPIRLDFTLLPFDGGSVMFGGPAKITIADDDGALDCFETVENMIHIEPSAHSYCYQVTMEVAGDYFIEQ